MPWRAVRDDGFQSTSASRSGSSRSATDVFVTLDWAISAGVLAAKGACKPVC